MNEKSTLCPCFVEVPVPNTLGVETIELRILSQGASQDFECYAMPGLKFSGVP